MVLAAADSANPSAGVSRRGRARPSGKNASTEWSVTTISMSASGEYGGTPQQAASSSSRTSSSCPSPNRTATSSMGAEPTVASQPTIAINRRNR